MTSKASKQGIKTQRKNDTIKSQTSYRVAETALSLDRIKCEDFTINKDQ